jgi:chaperonin cofactor prefoldin
MNNDQEWRAEFRSKFDKLEAKIDTLNDNLAKVDKEMTTLKVKVTGFASLFGSIATMIINKIMGQN